MPALIFVNAVLPAALSQIVAWAGMCLETNFSERAILGTVGTGGVGCVISNSLQGYDYGTAGAVILLVADTCARTVISPIILPVGAITSLLGAPMFFYMLLKGKRAQ